MEIHQLKYFLALCETLNYSRAAERLYLSRQALRQSMAALERDLGEPLFCNQRNRLSLTERGQWLRSRAEPIVRGFDALQQDIYATLRPAGQLALGVSKAILPDYLPELPCWLEQLHTRCPNLRLEVRLLPNDEVLAGVEQGSLALGLIMDLASAAYKVKKRVLRRDPLCLMLSQEHPRSGQAALQPAQLAQERVLVPGQRPEPFASLFRLLGQGGAQFEVAHSFYEANYLVRSQGCVCITRDDPWPARHFVPTVDIPLAGAEPICASLLLSAGAAHTAAAGLVQQYLLERCAGSTPTA